MSLWRTALKSAVGIGELAQESASRLEGILKSSLLYPPSSCDIVGNAKKGTGTRYQSKDSEELCDVVGNAKKGTSTRYQSKGSEELKDTSSVKCRPVAAPLTPNEEKRIQNHSAKQKAASQMTSDDDIASAKNIQCASEQVADVRVENIPSESKNSNLKRDFDETADHTSEDEFESSETVVVKKRRLVSLVADEKDIEDSIVIASDSDESDHSQSNNNKLQSQIIGNMLGVTLTFFDFETLRPGRWLTSNIIKAYYGALTLEKRLEGKFGWVDSMLYSQLAKEGNKRKKVVDFSDKLAYFATIHKEKNHWCLLLISNVFNKKKKRTVLYLDPRKPKAVDRTALNPLFLLDTTLKGAACVSFCVQQNSAQPQSNSDLCGVYVCWYIDQLMDVVKAAKTGESLLTNARKCINRTSMKKMVDYRNIIRDVLIVNGVEDDGQKRKTMVAHWDEPGFGLLKLKT